MPTARAPWTPRRVMPPEAIEMDCAVAPRLDDSYPDIPEAPSLAARIVNAAYWTLGGAMFAGLVTACVRSSALFQS